MFSDKINLCPHNPSLHIFLNEKKKKKKCFHAFSLKCLWNSQEGWDLVSYHFVKLNPNCRSTLMLRQIKWEGSEQKSKSCSCGNQHKPFLHRLNHRQKRFQKSVIEIIHFNHSHLEIKQNCYGFFTDKIVDTQHFEHLLNFPALNPYFLL